MKPHMSQALASVGHAVWMCQVFETLLAPIYEFFKMNVQPGYFDKTKGFVPDSAYKNPLRSIVKELSARNQIDISVEAKLDRYIEDRHLLVHRWFIQNGWPSDDYEEGWRALEIHANSVRDQAQELARYFTGYIVEHAAPGLAEKDPSAYTEKLSILFRQSSAE
jgi:hypothetical protein